MIVPILSLVTFLPLGGALLLIFFPAERTRMVRFFALGVAVLTFLLSLALYFGFDSGISSPQFVEQRAWIGHGIQYHLGIDGISLFLVLLTTFLIPAALLASWGGIGERIKEFSFFMLLLETGLIGVFVSLNLFLFYVFWEAMLIPMYFIIGIWGGRRRVYATLKFVIFTMFGSLLMLVAILVLYAQYHRATGVYSFSVLDYYGLSLEAGTQTWLFLAFALAFAIKIPLFPLHTWLPDAHIEAPTPGSIILAAVLLKMGAYGFIRFALPLFPDATRRFLPYLSLLAAFGIIYGGLMALVQRDMKSLVAYSSISHMGLIMLAVFSLNFEALEGALYQMLNHGLSTGALFLCVGLLYERSHTRQIKDFGGVGRQMPVFSALFLTVMLSSMGLPGLNGFVGEVLCFFGIFSSNKVLAVPAVATAVLSAAYLLLLFQKVMHGPIVHESVRAFKDVGKRELAILVPVIVLMFWMGLFPGPFLRKMDASVAKVLALAKGKERVSLLPGAAGAKSPAVLGANDGKMETR